MTRVFNVYCDESCHLENDRQKAMVLGAVWCPLEKTREIAVRIREMKARHDLPPELEIKWVKVSPAKVQFYRRARGMSCCGRLIQSRGHIGRGNFRKSTKPNNGECRPLE